MREGAAPDRDAPFQWVARERAREADALWAEAVGPTCTMVEPYRCDVCGATWSVAHVIPCAVLDLDDGSHPPEGAVGSWAEDVRRCAACVRMMGERDEEDFDA